MNSTCLSIPKVNTCRVTFNIKEKLHSFKSELADEFYGKSFKNDKIQTPDAPDDINFHIIQELVLRQKEYMACLEDTIFHLKGEIIRYFKILLPFTRRDISLYRILNLILIKNVPAIMLSPLTKKQFLSTSKQPTPVAK